MRDPARAAEKAKRARQVHNQPPGTVEPILEFNSPATPEVASMKLPGKEINCSGLYRLPTDQTPIQSDTNRPLTVKIHCNPTAVREELDGEYRERG